MIHDFFHYYFYYAAVISGQESENEPLINCFTISRNGAPIVIRVDKMCRLWN